MFLLCFLSSFDNLSVFFIFELELLHLFCWYFIPVYWLSITLFPCSKSLLISLLLLFLSPLLLTVVILLCMFAGLTMDVLPNILVMKFWRWMASLVA